MSRINPLRRLYDDLTEKLSKDEVRRLRDLLSEDQITTREKEDLKTPTDIFTKLEKSGHISETDLKLLKDLLEAIGRRPLVSEVERVEKELQVWRMERFSDESKVKSTDVQFSVGGDVTASSEISSAAVHREMVRTMEDPEGEPTSLQHHIDNHSLRHAQYITTTNVQAKPQLQGQEQADGNTGSIPSKRRKGSAESTCITESKYPDAVVSCEKYLKSLYVKLSEILPFPWWDGTNRLKLENVYTELELQTKKGEKREFSRRAIFSSRKDEDSQTTPKRVLIEGNPGYGKSSFCKKLIYDWAKGGIEYLNRFKVMFHFELRDLLDSDAQNIQDAVFNQLLKNVRDESERSELWNFVQSNQEKVCFVFDGLDEVPTKDLPPYFKEMIKVNCSLPDCPVIVTSRKIRDKNPEQRYDTQLAIKGFDYEKAKSFIEKHMNEMNSYGTEVTASDFLQELEKSSHKFVLTDFMQSPLNTLMLCDIWIHSKKLPNTCTQLYEEIIDYVVERYKESHDCDSHFEEEIKQALFLIGEMSYKGLTTHERKVYFSEKDISHNLYIRELGLLTKVSEFPSRYGFYHLTFQEYFASVYVAHLLSVDRCKFIDAITLLSQERGLYYNNTVYTFLGGKLQDNVDQIFKAMQEKGIFPNEWSYFDPREVMYESCCKSTSVFEHCAKFLPSILTIDLDMIDSHSDSNRLNVNIAILQCNRTISKKVWFKLKVKADKVAMFSKCCEALQKNSKKFDSIDVSLIVDFNDCKVKGGDHIEDFTFINNTQHQSLADLNPTDINVIKIGFIKIEISKHVKSANAFTNCHLIAILKSFSLVSADYLSIEGLPLGNLEFISSVIESLSSNKIGDRISMEFCNDCADDWSMFLLIIQAQFGIFRINFKINDMDFKLVDLQKLLSTFASADEKLSLWVSIRLNFTKEIISRVTDVVDTHDGVDIDPLILIIKGSRDSNKKDICPSISSNEEATAKVSESAKELDIRRLPPGSLDLMREVLNYLNGNKHIRSISIGFSERRFRYILDRDVDKSNITTHFGKFYIDYNSNMMEFDLADLLSLDSTLTPVENESISLNFEIYSDVSKKTADIIRCLQSADLEQLQMMMEYPMPSHLYRKNESIQDFWLNEVTVLHLYRKNESIRDFWLNEDMYAHIQTIVEELSRVSAKKLHIRTLPLGNIEFMNHVIGCLRNSQRLGFVCITFHEICFDNRATPALGMKLSFAKFRVRYNMNTMDFKLADLPGLFPTSVSGNKRVLPDVVLTCYLEDGDKLDIAEVLSKFESVEIGQLSLNINSESLLEDLKKIDFHFSTANRVKALSRVSANKLVIEGLPFGNLELMKNVFGCLSCCKLLKTVDVTFLDNDLFSWYDSTIEIYARIGKFHLLFRMNGMDFNLLSLRQSLTQSLSLDYNGVIFAVTVYYDLNKSANTELREIFKKLVTVNIAKMSLHMSYDTNISIEDIYSRTSDMLQTLSMINAKSFVIEGLPHGNAEFTESVHTDLEKSLCDKVTSTHISFRPPCCTKCKLGSSHHTTVTARNQKHIREICIYESKLDIFSLYAELHKELSTHDQRFLIDAQIYCTSNIEDDIQYILAASKSIMFNKIEYVEGSDNKSPAIDVLEKLTDVNTRQLSYKSNNLFGYELTWSVVNTMLQCQSAETFAISLVQEFNDIKISENIKKLVNDGIIIHGVKLFGRELTIQGTYTEETNTQSKVIEVEFTLKHEFDRDFICGGMNYIILNDTNAFIHVYMKIFYGLHTISELKSLCIELPDLTSPQFKTLRPCEFTIENTRDCVLALRYLTKVTIVGGKIISTDNSSEKWTDLCSKESLQMLTFEGCDLNSSCQSVIDSFNKSDERRCNQLMITLSDSLCLQNMNLMKDMLLSKSFDLNDVSVSQGEIVFSLKGKSISIFASTSANL